MKKKKESMPGDMYNAYKKKKLNIRDMSLNKSGTIGTEPISKGGKNYTELKFGKLGKIDLPSKKSKKKMMKPKPQGKGIVKALGQKGTTGNFKKIEKKAGKGAAIGALINKYDKVHGKKPRYAGKKKKMDKNMKCKK